MRKDGIPLTGGVTGNPVGKLLFCFETRPLLATVLALSLLMFIWTFQPYYENFLFPPTTTITTHSAVTTTTSPPCNCTTPKLTLPTSSSSAQLLSLSSLTTTTRNETQLIRASKTTNNKNTNVVVDPNKRKFKAYGNAAALFVTMGAYRGGVKTFSVIGLASKPIHVYGKPWYKCEWVPDNGSPPVRAKAYKILPDWGYGRVYTVVVVNCTFATNPNSDNSGGKLILYAYYSQSPRTFEKFEVMEEKAGTFVESKYTEKPKLDYLYCGSSLYGNLSAARIREWIAYHAWIFGERSHFVFHDAGGVTEEVRAVLEPWVKLGRATIQDIRDQDQYDGYYYNQFLVVNDCLHRYKFDAKWTFFYDVDEYIYLPDGRSLENVMKEFEPFTQFTIEQNPMNSKLCLNDSTQDYTSQWGFEKLVFRDVRTRIRRDRKYAIQPRNAHATGVHMSENVVGKTLHKTESKIRYYHYHNSIQIKEEPCRVFLPPSAKKTVTMFEKLPYVYDQNMTKIAETVKQFERQTLGTYQKPS